MSSVGLGHEYAPDHFVTLSSSSGHRVKILLDAQVVQITGGHGGWEVIDRPKRTSITRWKGKTPYSMDLPVIFNGIHQYRNMEPDIQTLIKMAEPVGHLKPPPTIRVRGAALPLPAPSIWWVISDMSWDSSNVTWYRFGHLTGRVRQSVVIHLLQFIDEQILVTSPSPAVLNGAAGGGRVVKSKGGTAKDMAQEHYGDPSKYQLILTANPWASPDTRQAIAAGKDVVIPDVNKKLEIKKNS